jgi:S1-C subfamily serine protease
MNKRWLWILLGVIAFFVVLFSGAIAGAGLTYLALQVEPVKAAIDFSSASINLASSEDGILVMHVEPDSPVAEAGIQRGDIILALDGKPVNSSVELMEALESKEAGDEITLTVKHCEATREFSVELEERDGQVYTGLHPARTRIFSISPHGDRLTGHLEIGPAFLITRVIPSSPAQEAGLRVGDIILAIDGEEIQSGDDLADIVHAKQHGEKLDLTIIRSGDENSQEVTVTLAENPDVENQAYLGVNYLHLPGFEELPDGEQPYFHFEMPGFEGEGIPVPQLPFDIMPFEHDFPQLPEGVEQAVVIGTVTPDSPADEAGLEPGDLITALDGEPVSDKDTFVESIRSFEPGDEITLTVFRSGEKEPLEIEVILGENPEEDGQVYLGVSITGFMRIERGDSPSVEPFNFQFPWNSEPWKWEPVNPVPGEDT